MSSVASAAQSKVIPSVITGDTSRSICSDIVETVFGLAEDLTTGTIGLPMMLPCPVVNKCKAAPPAANNVTDSAAADDVSMKCRPDLVCLLYTSDAADDLTRV